MEGTNWNMQYLLDDLQKEWENEIESTTKLAPPNYRIYIRKLSKKLKISGNGIPCLVCKLLEMFIAELFHIFMATEPNNEDVQRFQTFLRHRMFRYIMSCFTIITKHHSKNISKDLLTQTAYMIKHGISSEKHKETESNILKLLGSKIPTLSSYDNLLYLLNCIQCPPNWVAFITSVLDSAELHRGYILKDMNETASFITNPNDLYYLPNLHLTVATVIASTQTFNFMNDEADCIFSFATALNVETDYLDYLSQYIKKYFISPAIKL